MNVLFTMDGLSERHEHAESHVFSIGQGAFFVKVAAPLMYNLVCDQPYGVDQVERYPLG